ncbi:hypothetical protein [Streptomyces phage phiScoe1]|nr:hypothetical protein [Streptomyces phage phiScoe1]
MQVQVPAWAIGFVALLVGVRYILIFVLDQIPKISRKAIRAIKSVRAVWDELKHQPPNELDE